jgi:hypothetical protein
MTRYMRKKGELPILVLNEKLHNFHDFEVMPENFDVSAYNATLAFYKGKPPKPSITMNPYTFVYKNSTEPEVQASVDENVDEPDIVEEVPKSEVSTMILADDFFETDEPDAKPEMRKVGRAVKKNK